MEYRLRLPGNVLFLIHYLSVRHPCVPVRPALPSSKVSPIYLQQQYHLYLQQQQQSQRNANSSQPTRTSSPKPPVTATQVPTNKDPNAANEPNMDLLDGFTEYDAAAYRFILGKAVLMSIFDSHSSVANGNATALSSHPGLTDDLIAAMKRKVETIDSRISLHKTEHAERVKAMLEARARFTEACEAIQRVAGELELNELMETVFDSDVDCMREESVFISL